MGNKKQLITFVALILVFFYTNSKLRAQTFINPIIGYGVTKLNHITSSGVNYPNPESKVVKVYTSKVHVGFSIIKYLNKYLSADLQSDVGYQKMRVMDNSFLGVSGAYFWYFRNSIIAYRNIGNKWRIGLGLNFDYLTSNHVSYNLISRRVELGSTSQIEYQLNDNFNLHISYRYGFKAINIRPANYDPLQSLNIGLGYRFMIKK